MDNALWMLKYKCISFLSGWNLLLLHGILKKREMNDVFVIRQEKATDFSQVAEVIELAFRNMEENDHTEHFLVERLRESDAYIPDLSLVAETTEGQIVGHIMLSKVKVQDGEKVFTALAVAPLSVLPEYQRMGIGGKLIREAHRRASELGYAVTVLLGHKDYYPRFGYKKASLFGIRFPFEAPDDYCMVAELKKNGLEDLRGMVCYPDAFGL